MQDSRHQHRKQMIIAAMAAFCTYFCMYAFRKPFTAGTYEGQELYGFGLKTLLVISQLAGYMVSKFIGIKVISEMKREFRAVSIIGLILLAEMALVGFAFVPAPLKPVMLFFNGLPLGMIFGLVLAYLEGRKHTEALSAALCASFIMSSGVVKSVGRWLVQDIGVSEFQMPMFTGFIFLLPLLVSVWVLQATPEPNDEDRKLRAERKVMSRAQRQQFLSAYWPGLSLLVFVYVALTVVRTIRDDFGVEIWRDMGIAETPSIFARSETVVAIFVTGLNALAIWIVHNMAAIRATVVMMCLALGLVIVSTLLQPTQIISPFGFMVACGVGLYVPYVAFHTTVFERLIAASRHPGNLGFLMYLADATGYLGYAFVMVLRTSQQTPVAVLPFFRWSLFIVAGVAITALLVSLYYFQRVFGQDTVVTAADVDMLTATDLAAAE